MRKSRSWTEEQVQLLGTRPDYEIGRLIGKPGKAVWAKRRSMGIPDPALMTRRWTEEEDKVVLSQPVAEAARRLGRTTEGVKIRRARLRRILAPTPGKKLLAYEEVQRRMEVPHYSSPEEEERMGFVGGPYAPTAIPADGCLNCEIHGRQRVGGYSDALIPWPVSEEYGNLIICGDLLKALKTESRQAVSFHFGVTRQTVSCYRKILGIERYTAGSIRLFWRSVKLAGTAEAGEKMSRQREGRQDSMSTTDRERLRKVQKRPKSEAWKRRMRERWQRRYRLIGKPEAWSAEDLKLIGTRRDREVAKLLNRSVQSVRAKKFQLRRKSKQDL